MSNFGVVASIVLWLLVIAQGFVIVVVLRHIGVLYERIGPVGALTAASPLTIGARAPPFILDGPVHPDRGAGRRGACCSTAFVCFAILSHLRGPHLVGEVLRTRRALLGRRSPGQ
jgi:hypothetical protein